MSEDDQLSLPMLGVNFTRILLLTLYTQPSSLSLRATCQFIRLLLFCYHNLSKCKRQSHISNLSIPSSFLSLSHLYTTAPCNRALTSVLTLHQAAFLPKVSPSYRHWWCRQRPRWLPQHATQRNHLVRHSYLSLEAISL